MTPRYDTLHAFGQLQYSPGEEGGGRGRRRGEGENAGGQVGKEGRWGCAGGVEGEEGR